MTEEELELMKQIDEQIEINQRLKDEIKKIEDEIAEHNESIEEARQTIEAIKGKGI
jgi:peptidoglycan hydrolase CwlO-like protein